MKHNENKSFSFIPGFIIKFLKKRKEIKMIARHREGYLKYPETIEEIEEAVTISARALAEDPWE